MVLFLKFCVLDIQGLKNDVFRNALSILKEAKKTSSLTARRKLVHYQLNPLYSTPTNFTPILSCPNKAVDISQKEFQLS
jgi:hypothetical protein